jgi:hypothetical protein
MGNDYFQEDLDIKVMINKVNKFDAFLKQYLKFNPKITKDVEANIRNCLLIDTSDMDIFEVQKKHNFNVKLDPPDKKTSKKK